MSIPRIASGSEGCASAGAGVSMLLSWRGTPGLDCTRRGGGGVGAKASSDACAADAASAPCACTTGAGGAAARSSGTICRNIVEAAAWKRSYWRAPSADTAGMGAKCATSAPKGAACGAPALVVPKAPKGSGQCAKPASPTAVDGLGVGGHSTEGVAAGDRSTRVARRLPIVGASPARVARDE